MGDDNETIAAPVPAEQPADEAADTTPTFDQPEQEQEPEEHVDRLDQQQAQEDATAAPQHASTEDAEDSVAGAQHPDPVDATEHKVPSWYGPYKPGDMVWVKVRGFPYWPAIVLLEHSIPRQYLKYRKNPASICILFYGTREFGFAAIDEIKPYHKHKDEFSSKAASNKQLSLAIDEAETPGVLDIALLPNYTDLPTGDESPKEKKKTLRRSKSTSALKKRKVVDDDDDEESYDNAPEPVVKKSRRESSATTAPKRRHSVAAPTKKSVAVEEPKKQPEATQQKTPSEKLLSLRHRLQRIFLGEQVRTEYLARVPAVLSDLEAFDVSVDLLKETKVGKVLKRVSKLELDQSVAAEILPRVNSLLDKWRRLFLPPMQDAAVGSTSDETNQPTAIVKVSPEEIISSESPSVVSINEETKAGEVKATVEMTVDNVENTEKHVNIDSLTETAAVQPC